MDANAPEFDTAFTQRPSHGVKPEWLEAARVAKVLAEKVERETIDAWEKGRRGITYEAKELAMAQAAAAGQMYDDLYDCWQRGEVPASVALKLDTLISL
jgi:hypothetical protein